MKKEHPMNRGPVKLAAVCIAMAAFLCQATVAGAQEGDETKISIPAKIAPVPVKSGKAKSKPRPDFPPFTSVMEGFTGPYRGFYSIYENKKKNRLYAVIPSSQIKKPFLLATSFAGGTTFAGWQWNDYYLYWKVMGKQLVLMEKNVNYKGGSSAEVASVVKRTYTDRVFMTVPIRTKGGSGYVIDFGGLLAGSSSRFFGGMGRGTSSLAEFKFKAFPYNVEVTVTMPGSGGRYISLHYSLADVNKLSTRGYKPRLADDRVGYFLTAAKDFSNTKDPQRFVRYINRWNLQKRDPKLKLSPPKKPIVFYIEKTVPVRYRRYVREGIEMWNKAYEKCGFLNAIDVRQQDDYNPEFKNLDPEDMRFNFFRWITSERAFAMGPSRANPVTGEIIDADIIMDDSMVLAYLREYEEVIRGLNEASLTDEKKAYLRAHPERHPDRILQRGFMAKKAPACSHCASQRRQASDQESATDPASFMNRFRQCTIGSGKMREMALSGLYFSLFEDDDDKKKKDKDKDKKKGDKKTDGKKKDKKKAPKKKKEFPEEFIGQVIREIVCHEVGHTLGLRHNFKGSTYRALKEINSKVKPGDIGGSVMDYNPVNLALEGPQGKWAMTELGPYDYWAIEYGYKPVKKPKELQKIAQRGADKGLDYGTDEDVGQGDPTINRWDLGNDPIAYAKSRLGLVKKLRKNLIDRAVDKGEGYQKLRRAFDMLLFEIRRAGDLAAQYVGSHHLYRDHRGDPKERDPVVIVPAKKQREGLKFVCDYILSDKLFDFPPELLRKLAQQRWMHWGTYPGRDLSYPLHERILNVQTWVLFPLFYPGTLRRIYNAEHMVDRNKDCLTLVELFNTLGSAIWSELGGTPGEKATDRKPYISSIRRNLQRYCLEELTDIALDPNSSTMPSSIRTLARFHVKRLKKSIDGFLNKNGDSLDTYTRSHLEECSVLLDKTLKAAYQLGGNGGGSSFFYF